MIKFSNLCCENLPAPLGISNPSPRFSWTWTSNSENSSQLSWRIQVADNDGFTSCVWDSGDIASDQQVAVTYAGEPLEIRSGYFWRVKISAVSGECSDWSESAYFETGFFSIDDWDSFWVPHCSGGRRNSTVNHLRRDFILPQGKEIERARAYIGATCGPHYEDTFRMNLYVLRLNGRKVSDDLYNPGQLSHAKGRALYRTYDIREILQVEANAVGIIYAAERISLQIRMYLIISAGTNI